MAVDTRSRIPSGQTNSHSRLKLCEVDANAVQRAETERLENISLVASTHISLKPSFRDELSCVFERRLVAIGGKCCEADGGPAGDKPSKKGATAGWHTTLEESRNWWIESHRFVEDRKKVLLVY